MRFIASSVTGYFACQYARLAGLRVIAVADIERHAERLKEAGVEHIVDRHNSEAAIAKIKHLTQGHLLYALDCIGARTATLAMQCLAQDQPSWLVGLTGLPKTATGQVTLCEVVS